MGKHGRQELARRGEKLTEKGARETCCPNGAGEKGRRQSEEQNAEQPDGGERQMPAPMEMTQLAKPLQGTWG